MCLYWRLVLLLSQLRTWALKFFKYARSSSILNYTLLMLELRFYLFGLYFLLLINTYHVYEQRLGAGGNFLHRFDNHVNMLLIYRIVFNVYGTNYEIQALILYIVDGLGNLFLLSYDFFKKLTRLSFEFIFQSPKRILVLLDIVIEMECVVTDKVFVLNMLDKLLFFLGVQLLWVVKVTLFINDDSLVMGANFFQIIFVLSHWPENTVFSFIFFGTLFFLTFLQNVVVNLFDLSISFFTHLS